MEADGARFGRGWLAALACRIVNGAPQPNSGALDRLLELRLRPVVVPIALALSLACDNASSRMPSSDKLKADLALLVGKGPGTIVSLDSMLPGDWRDLYVFGAYTPQEYIDRCVGTSVDGRSIGVQDGYVLIVLTSSEGNPSSLDIRGGVAFDRAALGRVYPRGTASFIVNRDTLDFRNKLVPQSGLPRSCS